MQGCIIFGKKMPLKSENLSNGGRPAIPDSLYVSTYKTGIQDIRLINMLASCVLGVCVLLSLDRFSPHFMVLYRAL